MSTIVPFDTVQFASDGFEFKVDIAKSVGIPKPGFEPQKRMSGDWLFPENIHLITDEKHGYLYAFGDNSHVWRTKDVESWERVR